ncbi:MAG: nuclear transport factor 2 family protein [Phycicoccus sp.]
MTTSTRPVDVSQAFLEAFRTRDRDGATRFVHRDVVFRSPRITVRGRDAYLEEVFGFAGLVDHLDLHVAVGDDHHAVLIYEMHTPDGVVRAADTYEVVGGTIVRNDLLFDTAALAPGRSTDDRWHGG